MAVNQNPLGPDALSFQLPGGVVLPRTHELQFCKISPLQIEGKTDPPNMAQGKACQGR